MRAIKRSANGQLLFWRAKSVWKRGEEVTKNRHSAMTTDFVLKVKVIPVGNENLAKTKCYNDTLLSPYFTKVWRFFV